MRLFSNESASSGQNRHCVRDIRERAAAIFSSMVWLISSSEVASSTMSVFGGEDTGTGLGMSCFVGASWLGDPLVTDRSSLSLCRLEFKWDR